MIIVPELKTVVLLVPRTGSGSLYRSLLRTYPKAMMLYRHMEASGIPMGYDMWAKVGVIRDPYERLWSLYHFLRNRSSSHKNDYKERLAASVDRPFADWVIDNDTVFTDPFESRCTTDFYPEFTVQYAMPETNKPQVLTLRPDLGTEVFQFGDTQSLEARLGIKMIHTNATLSAHHRPEPSGKLLAILKRRHIRDLTYLDFRGWLHDRWK